MSQNEPDPRWQLTIPWWKEKRRLRAGDAVAGMAKAVGFKKPCGACRRRRKALNRVFGLRGRRRRG